MLKNKKLKMSLLTLTTITTMVVPTIAASCGGDDKNEDGQNNDTIQINLGEFSSPNELVTKIVDELNARMPHDAAEFIEAYDKNEFDKIFAYTNAITANKKFLISFNGKQIELDFSDVQNKIELIKDILKNNDVNSLPRAESLSSWATNPDVQNPEMTALGGGVLGSFYGLAMSDFLSLGSGTVDPDDNETYKAFLTNGEYYQMLNAYHDQIWKLVNSGIYKDWVKDKEYNIVEWDRGNIMFSNKTIKPNEGYDNQSMSSTLIPRAILREDGQTQISNLELVFVEEVLNSKEIATKTTYSTLEELMTNVPSAFDDAKILTNKNGFGNSDNEIFQFVNFTPEGNSKDPIVTSAKIKPKKDITIHPLKADVIELKAGVEYEIQMNSYKDVFGPTMIYCKVDFKIQGNDGSWYFINARSSNKLFSDSDLSFKTIPTINVVDTSKFEKFDAIPSSALKDGQEYTLTDGSGANENIEASCYELLDSISDGQTFTISGQEYTKNSNESYCLKSDTSSILQRYDAMKLILPTVDSVEKSDIEVTLNNIPYTFNPGTVENYIYDGNPYIGKDGFGDSIDFTDNELFDIYIEDGGDKLYFQNNQIINDGQIDFDQEISNLDVNSQLTWITSDGSVWAMDLASDGSRGSFNGTSFNHILHAQEIYSVQTSSVVYEQGVSLNTNGDTSFILTKLS